MGTLNMLKGSQDAEMHFKFKSDLTTIVALRSVYSYTLSPAVPAFIRSAKWLQK